MADDKFRLPKSSYEELVKIIGGYAQFDHPASLDEVSKQVGMHTTIISKNAGFLLDAGILLGGAKKQCTSSGNELAHALIHGIPDEIRRLWRTIIRECEFLSRILAAVKIRNGMDETTISSHIAYSAGQKKNPGVMTGARSVVDILKAAELLREENGKLTAVDVKTVDASSGEATTYLPCSASVSALPQENGIVKYAVPAALTAGLNVNITVKVECTLAELDGLGAKLKQVIHDLSQKDTDKGES